MKTNFPKCESPSSLENPIDLFKHLREGRLEIAHKYIRWDWVDINTKDEDNHTVLMWAARMGISKLVALLLKKGAEIDAKDNKGLTALMYATGNGHLQSVNLLLKAGANVDIESRVGYDSVNEAYHKGCYEIRDIFLQWEKVSQRIEKELRTKESATERLNPESYNKLKTIYSVLPHVYHLAQPRVFRKLFPDHKIKTPSQDSKQPRR